MIYAIIGIPLCLVMFQAVGERLNYFTSWFIQIVKKTFRLKSNEVNQTELVFVGGFLAFVAIFGGAAMFTHYEGWSYFNSIYYCVVTLTTIGFGDYVALQVHYYSSSISFHSHPHY
jgi:potassium channel subfamily K protein 9